MGTPNPARPGCGWRGQAAASGHGRSVLARGGDGCGCTAMAGTCGEKRVGKRRRVGGGSSWALAGRKAHHRLRCAHRQSLHPGCDGLTDAARRTPVCRAPAVPAPQPHLNPCSCPVPARSCLVGHLEGLIPLRPGRPAGLHRGSSEQDQPLALLGCQRGNSLQRKIHLKRNKNVNPGPGLARRGRLVVWAPCCCTPNALLAPPCSLGQILTSRWETMPPAHVPSQGPPSPAVPVAGVGQG